MTFTHEFIRKDRMETRNKTGGGLILYFRNSLNTKEDMNTKYLKLKQFGQR